LKQEQANRANMAQNEMRLSGKPTSFRCMHSYVNTREIPLNNSFVVI